MKKIDKNSPEFKLLKGADFRTLYALYSRVKKSVADDLEALQNITGLYHNNVSVASGNVTKIGVSEHNSKFISTKSGKIKFVDRQMVIPSAEKIATEFEPIQNVWHAIALFEQMEIMLESGDVQHQNAKSTLKEIKVSLDELSAAADDALATLAEIAEKHIPNYFLKLAKSIASSAIAELEDTNAVIGANAVELYASTENNSKKGLVQYHAYIPVSGFEVEDGYESNDYFLVLTGKVDKHGAIDFYLTSLNAFHPPGTFKPGIAIEGKSDAAMARAAKKAVRDILALSNILGRLSRSDVPVTANDIRLAVKNKVAGIDKVRVMNRAIWFIMKPGVDDDEIRRHILPNLLPLIDPLVGNRMRTVQNKMYKLGTTKAQHKKASESLRKRVEDVNGRKVLSIILTPSGL